MKSSHDVLKDPKLSSQPVVETTAAVVKVKYIVSIYLIIIMITLFSLVHLQYFITIKYKYWEKKMYIMSLGLK